VGAGGEQFLGEIRIMSFNFPPRGWALCNGQLLPINQNQALFALLGTTYGGNGQTTFALPDLRRRAPVHKGSLTLGGTAGEEQHTLTGGEMPLHDHALQASAAPGNAAAPAGKVLARRLDQPYLPAAGALVPMHLATVASVGGNQAHQNTQPLLTLSFCIALVGIFPSQH
jgi:microcystin-dependent protein